MRLIVLFSPILLVPSCAPAGAQEQNDALVANALAGQFSFVQEAIEDGADINSLSRNGASLVMAAEVKNHVELLEYLLAEGADPNLANAQGRTPLYVASMIGHTGAVDILLRFNADPNVSIDSPYPTPLMIAAINNRAEVVRVLLDAGADPQIRNLDGRTVSDIVDQVNQPEIAALFDTSQGQSHDVE